MIILETIIGKYKKYLDGMFIIIFEYIHLISFFHMPFVKIYILSRHIIIVIYYKCTVL